MTEDYKTERTWFRATQEPSYFRLGLQREITCYRRCMSELIFLLDAGDYLTKNECRLVRAEGLESLVYSLPHSDDLIEAIKKQRKKHTKYEGRWPVR